MDTIAAGELPNTYDVMRYPTVPQPNTAPSAFSVLAQLRGRRVPPFESARVLEIGCGDGVNLMSLAITAPGAEFVGFDLAAAPVAEGQEIIRAAGLTNVRLLQGDIMDPAVVEGEFDYIVAHGVYAWVPPRVRAGLMALVGRTLVPEGLAFISYNVAPGCSIRNAIRSVLRHEVEDIADPHARLTAAGDTLTYFAEGWAGRSAFSTAMAEEARSMLERDPAVLFHDELGGEFNPQLLGDVLNAARGEGLDYVCDAQPLLSRDAFFPTLASARVRERADGDWLRYEQLQDFLELRLFRQSLFTRTAQPVEHAADWTVLERLYADARIVREPANTPGVATFKTHDGLPVQIDSLPLAELLERIAAEWPGCLPLAGEVQHPIIGNALLQLYVSGIIRLRADPVTFTRIPGEVPQANPLARVQARDRNGLAVATMRHMAMRLPDDGARYFLGLLDGTRTRDQLAVEVAAYLGTSVEAVAAWLPGALEELARNAVMIG